MLDALDIGTIAVVVGLGIKGYMSIDKRLTKVEIMQRLLLRKNGYDNDGELDEAIATELNNHKRRGK